MIYIQKRVKISQIQRENVVDLLEATKKYCKAVYEGAKLEISDNENTIQSLQQSISKITADHVRVKESIDTLKSQEEPREYEKLFNSRNYNFASKEQLERLECLEKNRAQITTLEDELASIQDQLPSLENKIKLLEGNIWTKQNSENPVDFAPSWKDFLDANTITSTQGDRVIDEAICTSKPNGFRIQPRTLLSQAIPYFLDRGYLFKSLTLDEKNAIKHFYSEYKISANTWDNIFKNSSLNQAQTLHQFLWSQQAQIKDTEAAGFTELMNHLAPSTQQSFFRQHQPNIVLNIATLISGILTLLLPFPMNYLALASLMIMMLVHSLKPDETLHMRSVYP
ncbi:MAG: hypothetical protein CBD38_00025 [bacterium TMED178]|nr:MAG: hypothetical protein CBD38_00025 [bacterium TMED178]